MHQPTEKQEKSSQLRSPRARPSKPKPPEVPETPPDPAADAAAAEQAFHAGISAARGRVNALLAGLDCPPLPDWPLPDPGGEPGENAEESALDFLETVMQPSFYSRIEPVQVPGLMASMIRIGLKSLAEARGVPAPDVSAGERAANPRVSGAREAAPEGRPATIAQWEAKVRRVAGEHGGLLPLTEDATPFDGWRHVCLPESDGPPAPKSARPAQAPDETEAELNALIAECRVLMRDVAMQSARFSCGVDDRVRFIESACRAADAGATLGKIVARVRGATNSGQMGENRQRIIVERVERIPARLSAEGEGGA